MTITQPPRDTASRIRDVLARLDEEQDVWVSTADTAGAPYLVPLSFLWDGTHLWLCTRIGNPTGRNLSDGGRARLALGHTRDVVVLDGEVETYGPKEVPTEVADGFHAKTGWDPRGSGPAYHWFRVRPTAVEAWYEEPELVGRHIMRDGAWVEAP
ncbi:pyridoxamine 5'-phosphate oxidase family protein [Streptomyces sp. NPDC096079]|uniref:pyridoxamine 5'-phosphate oxidase family protein n=1 Tax=Streptomyces sp. NPDC096079 TaxID=3155820 RepID=UPI00331BF339